MNETLSHPPLTAADHEALAALDREKLSEWIAFLRSCRQILWHDGNIGDLVPLETVLERKIEPRVQSVPVYPEPLKEMGRFFLDLVLKRLELFPDPRLSKGCPLPWSPALTASFIADAWRRDRFFDGLFGRGVENGLYLKLLLSLEELLAEPATPAP